LAEHAPDRLLEIYRQLVSPQVTLKDLIVSGEYQRINRWNPRKPSHGRIVHLTQAKTRSGPHSRSPRPRPSSASTTARP